jgi:hypothetical protein
MAIRDLLVITLVFGCDAVGFFRPWLGVGGYAWVSYMNPHRFAWSFAYDFPGAYWFRSSRKFIIAIVMA